MRGPSRTHLPSPVLPVSAFDSKTNAPVSKSDEPQPGGLSNILTWRVILLAVIAQVGILFWVVRSEITARVFVSSWSLSMPGILLLLVLMTIAARARNRLLSRAEMLAAYIVVSGTITLAGYNFLQVMVVTLATGPYFANENNQWATLLEQLPAWLLPTDPEGLRGFFSGESTPNWSIWMTPLIAWGTFILAVGIAGIALNILLADGWIRKERLAFPIAAIPLEITGNPQIFRNRLLWIGFGLPVVMNSLLALHYYFPAIPAIELKHRSILPPEVGPPLSALQPVVIGWTPFIIGLAYLSPLDISFSIWFFQWFNKGQRLLAMSTGYLDPSDASARGAPNLDEQCVGAFVALGLIVLWRALPKGWLLGQPEPPSERTDRPLNWIAGGTLGASALFVIAFMWAGGIPVASGLVIMALYLLTVLVIARVRAEAGFAWTYGPDRGTTSISHVMMTVMGTGAHGPRGLAAIGLFHWFWWDLRFSLWPAQMEAFKIADSAGIKRRQVAVLLAGATLTAIVVGLFAVMQDSHQFGWATANVYRGPQAGGRVGYNLAMNWSQNPTPADRPDTYWMVAGGAFTAMLGFLRQRFVWWPFHPVGYAMAATATSYAFWSHYFIAWLVKVSVLRYGGMRLYRQSLPLVMGLILGDIVSQTVWSIGASALDIPVYQFVS